MKIRLMRNKDIKEVQKIDSKAFNEFDKVKRTRKNISTELNLSKEGCFVAEKDEVSGSDPENIQL